MKKFSQFVIESSKIQWFPTKAKVGEDGKISIHDVPRLLKTDGPKKEKPEGEGYVECKTCEGTGEIHLRTGRFGSDKEDGSVQAQYITGQRCPTCSGGGHYKPKEPKSEGERMRDFYNAYPKSNREW